jgi:rhodanese-related sulfurtransferase
MPFDQTIPRLIDVREFSEYANGSIPGSHHHPLGTLLADAANWPLDEPLLIVCKSGKRSQQALQQLTAVGFTQVNTLAGGIDQWIGEGKPLQSLPAPPWSLERQVRFTAGILVLLTLALGYASSRYFLLATTFVGAGLVFAGASDLCMMATVLGWLPWNRPRTLIR